MVAVKATDVRKQWSSVVDSVVREKPAFITRTRDTMLLTNLDLIENILKVYTFSAKKYPEEDGSITLSLNEIDLVANGSDEASARHNLAENIYEYANEYYNEFSFWSKAANRKNHIPYVIKALIIDDINKLEEQIVCLDGKN